MDIVIAAVLGFAAGFLACIVVGCAIVWWAFSDERQQDGGQREQDPRGTADRGG
jgi:hypothetical protein